MNENDGHLMLVARAQALEAIALEYMSKHATVFNSKEQLKERLESLVETKAPGCSHQVHKPTELERARKAFFQNPTPAMGAALKRVEKANGS